MYSFIFPKSILLFFCLATMSGKDFSNNKYLMTLFNNFIIHPIILSNSILFILTTQFLKTLSTMAIDNTLSRDPERKSGSMESLALGGTELSRDTWSHSWLPSVYYGSERVAEGRRGKGRYIRIQAKKRREYCNLVGEGELEGEGLQRLERYKCIVGHNWGGWYVRGAQDPCLC